MNKALLILSTIFMTFSANAQLPQGWDWQNPRPHGLTIYDIEMIDVSYAIAGCENGYIMRTFNAGATWYESRITGGSIYSLVCPDSKNVWAAAEDGAILFSSDYGVTWETQLPAQNGVSGYADIYMYDNMTGMATIPRDKVYRTTNGGETWEEIPAPYFGQDYGRWISAQTPSTWYIMGTVGSSPRLYMTTNFGDSWHSDTTFETRGLNNLTFVDSTYAFQCRNGVLLRTTNAGLSWDEMDIYGFGNVTDVIAGPGMNDRLFALSEGSVVVNASYDNGETWNVSLLENAFGYASPTAIDFASPSVGIVVGSGGRILRTTDGGQSWNIVHGIGFLGHIIDMAFTSPNDGVALTSTQTMLITSNGGERWIESTPMPGVSLQKISMYNETSGYAYGSDGSDVYYMYHTSDGGWTWEQRGKMYEVMTDERYIIPQAMYSDSPDRVYVGLSYGRLFRSTNGGMTFDSLALPPDLEYQFYSAMKIQTFEPDYITLIASNGVVQSSDGGESWAFHRVSSSRWLQAACFTAPETGYAIQSGNFSKTTNGGQQWQSTADDNNELLHFFNDNDGVMYCSEYNGDSYTGSIKRTSNGGESWTDHTLREQVEWDDWFWFSPDQGWAYGYGGMIRHTGSSGVVGTSPAPQAPLAFQLQDIYPNPLSLSGHSGLSVAFTTYDSVVQDVVIEVTDILGRKVFQTSGVSAAPGRNIVTISSHDLGHRSSGILHVSLVSGTKRITRRISITH